MDDTPHRSADADESTSQREPLLTPEEIRVLGCLIEKSRTTPDDYPLTANALMRATNQSTSRDPIVSYDAALIDRTLVGLKASGWVRFVHTPSGRATTRYRHVVDERLGLDARQTALVGLLMLRGPQTAPELLSRSERWESFGSLDEVVSTLRSLAARGDGLAILLDRQVGQREPRWTHALSGEPVLPDPGGAGASGPSRSAGSRGGVAEERVDALEARVAVLEGLVAELRAELGLAPPPSAEPTNGEATGGEATGGGPG